MPSPEAIIQEFLKSPATAPTPAVDLQAALARGQRDYEAVRAAASRTYPPDSKRFR